METITVTFGEINNARNPNAWEQFCDKYNINYWCMNEGRADGDETIKITMDEAETWGILASHKDTKKTLNQNCMTVTHLKKLIKDLPDDMKVGNIGHFGEFLEVWDAGVQTARFRKQNNCFSWESQTETEQIFAISIESAGEEPN